MNTKKISAREEAQPGFGITFTSLNLSTKTIADRINEHHRLAFWKAGEALESARQAGVLLIEAKAAVKHGEWLPWLAAHVEFSVSTAQGYMRLAERWGELPSNTQTVAHLTLRDALDCLAEPKDIQQEVAPSVGQDEEKTFLEKCRRDGCTSADYDRLTMIKCRLVVVAMENIQLALSEVSILPPENIDRAKELTHSCVQYTRAMLEKTTDATLGALLLRVSRSLADLLKGLDAVSGNPA